MNKNIRVPALVLGALVIFCRPSPAQSSDPLPQFDIAELRVSSGGTSSLDVVLHGDRFSLRGKYGASLIRAAYEMDGDQVIGGPPWLYRTMYDILAKAPPNTPPATLRLMLRSLLADRLKLVVRMDTKPLPS